MTENTENDHRNESHVTLHEDAVIGSTIESRVARDAWPPKQRRVQLFDRDDLTRVRLHSSLRYVHDEKKESIRKSCPLCYIDNCQKRKSAFSCKVCKVPLCTTKIGTATLTCFELWHSRPDLEAAYTEQRAALVTARDDSRGRGAHEHSRSIRRRIIDGSWRDGNEDSSLFADSPDENTEEIVAEIEGEEIVAESEGGEGGDQGGNLMADEFELEHQAEMNEVLGDPEEDDGENGFDHFARELNNGSELV